MQIQAYQKYQYMNDSILNAGQSLMYNNFLRNNQYFHTPGVANADSLAFGTSALTVTISATAPFGVQFESGVFTEGNGTTNGASSSIYSLDLTSNVPGSGTVSVYIVAQAAQVSEVQQLIVGPPPGHPDYDPSFSPTTAYLQTWDTFSVSATTDVPNNTSIIELARLPLSSGQSSIPVSSISTTSQVSAASLFVGSFVSSFNSRIGAVSAQVGDYSTWYGQLAATNNWTFGNVFNSATTLKGVTTGFANWILNCTQSGGAANSPTFEIQGWTGSAGIYHQLKESSAGILSLVSSTGSVYQLQISQNENLSLMTTSGGAASSPVFSLQGWTGSAAIGLNISSDQAGIFYIKNLSSTNLLAVNQSGNTTIYGTASVSGIMRVTGAASLLSNLSVAGTAGITGATTINGATLVNNAFAATGAVTLSSTLGVSNTITGGSNIVGAGNLHMTGTGTSFISGTLNIGVNCTINGNLVTVGTGNFNTSSLDFKTNVLPLVADIDKFMMLEPISYTHTGTKEDTVGFAAENMYGVYPELVMLQNRKPFAINYSGVIPYLVSIVKAQELRIEELEKRTLH